MSDTILMGGQQSASAVETNTAPAVRIQKADASSATKIKVAPEFQYARQMESDPFVTQRDSLIYCWNSNHWKLQTDSDNSRHALLWLGRHVPQRANAGTAEGCVKTALLLAKPLPIKPNRTTVPVQNGWIMFNNDHSLSLVKPDHRVGITHSVPVKCRAGLGDYTPAPLPADSLFANFIKSSLPDESVRELVQAYVGYTLCAHVKYQVGQLWIGARGSNGKSTMLNIVMALHEKAVAMQLDKLEGFNLANLIGATLIACDETPKGKIDQQVLKSLISGGTTSINRKFKDVISYQNRAKFIICSNHLPALTDQSDAFWRRLHVVEWNQTFSGDKIINDLDRKIIEDELHIVLDWALAGLQKLERDENFTIPVAVKQSVNKAKAESNNVVNWIQTYGVAYSDPEQPMIQKSALFTKYEEFCKENGFQACASSQFFARIHNEFPKLEEARPTIGPVGAKKRVYCVNLTMGVFSDDDLKEQVKAEADEINQVFGYQ